MIAQDKQYCTFFINDFLFGVAVDDVQEIMSEHRVSQVPLAPESVAGLVNYRGQIVTAIDMRKCLDFERQEAGAKRAMLVARCRGEVLGLLVDKIGDVITVDAADYEPAPENVRGNARAMIDGAYKLPDTLLLPLNLNKTAELSR